MYVHASNSYMLMLFCNFSWHIFIHSITAGTVVEYFVMVVQITECSYPAQQSQSECVTIVIIMCWDCHRGSTHHLLLINTHTHTYTVLSHHTSNKLLHKCCNFGFLFCINSIKRYGKVFLIYMQLYLQYRTRTKFRGLNFRVAISNYVYSWVFIFVGC